MGIVGFSFLKSSNLILLQVGTKNRLSVTISAEHFGRWIIGIDSPVIVVYAKSNITAISMYELYSDLRNGNNLLSEHA
jgi:hypothetical protein